MGKDPRDYGLPNSRPISTPRVVKMYDASTPLNGVQPECPLCTCQTLCEIEVEVAQPLIRGGRGIGLYLSCPACPWASPMTVRAATTHTPEA